MPISENTSERTSIPVVARRIPPCADPLLSTYGPGGNLDDCGLPDDVEVLAVDHLAVVFGANFTEDLLGRFAHGQRVVEHEFAGADLGGHAAHVGAGGVKGSVVATPLGSAGLQTLARVHLVHHDVAA